MDFPGLLGVQHESQEEPLRAYPYLPDLWADTGQRSQRRAEHFSERFGGGYPGAQGNP